MAENRNDDEAWNPTGRQLRADGSMTSEVKPVEAPVEKPLPSLPSSELPRLDSLSTGDLVLDRPAPASRVPFVEPGAYRPEVIPTRSSPTKWVLMLVALAALALAAFALVPGLQRKLPLPMRTPGSLVIDSEPSGATVKIAGKQVGQTPWAGDNLWIGEVKYEISAAGHKPRWGTFQGGDAVKLNVKLSKK